MSCLLCGWSISGVWAVALVAQWHFWSREITSRSCPQELTCRQRIWLLLIRHKKHFHLSNVVISTPTNISDVFTVQHSVNYWGFISLNGFALIIIPVTGHYCFVDSLTICVLCDRRSVRQEKRVDLRLSSQCRKQLEAHRCNNKCRGCFYDCNH